MGLDNLHFIDSMIDKEFSKYKKIFPITDKGMAKVFTLIHNASLQYDENYDENSNNATSTFHEFFYGGCYFLETLLAKFNWIERVNIREIVKNASKAITISFVEQLASEVFLGNEINSDVKCETFIDRKVVNLFNLFEDLVLTHGNILQNKNNLATYFDKLAPVMKQDFLGLVDNMMTELLFVDRDRELALILQAAAYVGALACIAHVLLKTTYEDFTHDAMHMFMPIGNSKFRYACIVNTNV